MRPVVKPALHRRWRDGQTLQLGIDPAVAVLLTGLQPSDRLVLELLDGRRTTGAVVADATEAGVSAEQTGRLLHLLDRVGVLDDATDPLAALPSPDQQRLRPELAALSLRTTRPGAAGEALARRQRSTVVLLGAGRIGAPLAALLSAAGIGVVDVRDATVTAPGDVVPGGLRSEHVGRLRDRALREALGLPAILRPPTSIEADLVVLTPSGEEEPTTPERLRRAGTPHLAVTVVDGAGIIGPLVRPGVSCCLHCLDLHRVDRDPSWPGRIPAVDGACDSALAVAIAALTALQVLAFLDALTVAPEPAVVGGTLELRPPDWRVRRRSWPPHPACGCAGAPADA